MKKLKINPKYQPGDTVFFILDNDVDSSTVHKTIITLRGGYWESPGKVYVDYTYLVHNRNVILQEEKLFSTKEELIKSL